LFFALSGLRTQAQLLPGNWLWMTVILLVAIAGKFGGASIGGLICRMEKSGAAALGILLNARGLVELIVLNVGYQAGILSATLFSMMIVMALTTTIITTPLLQLVFLNNYRLASAASSVVTNTHASDTVCVSCSSRH